MALLSDRANGITEQKINWNPWKSEDANWADPPHHDDQQAEMKWTLKGASCGQEEEGLLEQLATCETAQMTSGINIIKLLLRKRTKL